MKSFPRKPAANFSWALASIWVMRPLTIKKSNSAAVIRPLAIAAPVTFLVNSLELEQVSAGLNRYFPGCLDEGIWQR